MGPVMDAQRFVRAIATAAPAAMTSSGGPGAGAWRVSSVDADYDDESGQTGVSIEAEITANSLDVTLETVSFQALILTVG